MAESQARDIALKFIELYNVGTLDYYGSDRFTELYAEDVEWIEMPTRRFPAGRTGGLEMLREAVKGGQASLRNRRATLRQVVGEGDLAAMTYSWQATVISDVFGVLGLSPGDTMRLEVAQLIEVANGRIARSTEYVILAPAS